MNSPTKRRKLNGNATTTKPAHSLDFFFGKHANNSGGVTQTAPSGPLEESPDISRAAIPLSDEQLARQLQHEWNRIDQDASLESRLEPGEQPESSVQSNRLSDVRNKAATGIENDAAEGRSSVAAGDVAISNLDEATQKNTLSLQTATATEDEISITIPFDQSPLTFDPADYLSGLWKQWAGEGGSVTYALLTRCFVLINSTQSRIKIVDTLVNLLRTIIEGDPESLLPAVSCCYRCSNESLLMLSQVWLATNSISPSYVDLELGLGGSAISKALKKVCGLDSLGLKKLYDKHGDAGDVAFEAKKRQSFTLRKPKPLTIKSVYDSLARIANSKGAGSVESKQRIVERLVQDARGAEESRYIVRTLVQHVSA